MDSGEPDRVVAMRHDFQRVMATRYSQAIEELTGRRVVAFLSQAHVDPDITMEIFFVDRPLDGFGAVEVIEPEGPAASEAEPVAQSEAEPQARASADGSRPASRHASGSGPP